MIGGLASPDCKGSPQPKSVPLKDNLLQSLIKRLLAAVGYEALVTSKWSINDLRWSSLTTLIASCTILTAKESGLSISSPALQLQCANIMPFPKNPFGNVGLNLDLPSTVKRSLVSWLGLILSALLWERHMNADSATKVEQFLMALSSIAVLLSWASCFCLKMKDLY